MKFKYMMIFQICSIIAILTLIPNDKTFGNIFSWNGITIDLAYLQFKEKYVNSEDISSTWRRTSILDEAYGIKIENIFKISSKSEKMFLSLIFGEMHVPTEYEDLSEDYNLKSDQLKTYYTHGIMASMRFFENTSFIRPYFSGGAEYWIKADTIEGKFSDDPNLLIKLKLGTFASISRIWNFHTSAQWFFDPCGSDNSGFEFNIGMALLRK